MEVDEIVQALSGLDKHQVRFTVKKMHERQGLLNRIEGYYTPSDKGLRALDYVPEYLSTASVEALEIIAEHGPITVKVFAATAGKSLSNAGAMIAGLRDRELIEGADKRYTITAKGRRYLPTAEDAPKRSAAEVVAMALATQPNSVFNLGRVCNA